MRSGEAKPTFSVHYDEGLKVGYKWYDAENKPVLYPFGFGLSYTTFTYSGLKATAGPHPSVTFTVRNTGSRPGAEIAQVYAALPPEANEPPKRLVAFTKQQLAPGESKEITLAIDPRLLSIYDESKSAWTQPAGPCTLMVGPSSATLPLTEKITLP